MSNSLQEEARSQIPLREYLVGPGAAEKLELSEKIASVITGRELNGMMAEPTFGYTRLRDQGVSLPEELFKQRHMDFFEWGIVLCPSPLVLKEDGRGKVVAVGLVFKSDKNPSTVTSNLWFVIDGNFVIPTEEEVWKNIGVGEGGWVDSNYYVRVADAADIQPAFEGAISVLK